ncbi:MULTISPECIES: hypothetical protein [unclassified Legionella]|uniref:hypothetical protein n=1 Tax=unclassified Legionella TaxID=2622702 RepID=UPI001054E032|nr:MULTISPECIES: hypothetical protein [unclassified Legionella]MDI9818181.1 hypothetical protein [Legionella sp. PL877]
MSSRKELQNSINQLENKLQMEKARLLQHKQYFRRLIENHRYVLLGLLLPTFLAGWREGKRADAGKMLRGFLRFMLATALAGMREKPLISRVSKVLK